MRSKFYKLNIEVIFFTNLFSFKKHGSKKSNTTTYRWKNQINNKIQYLHFLLKN